LKQALHSARKSANNFAGMMAGRLGLGVHESYSGKDLPSLDTDSSLAPETPTCGAGGQKSFRNVASCPALSELTTAPPESDDGSISKPHCGVGSISSGICSEYGSNDGQSETPRARSVIAGDVVLDGPNLASLEEVTSHWKLPPNNGQVVIKVRSKAKGFKDAKDHEDWVRVVKMMYYISSGPSSQLSSIANMYDMLEDENFYYAVMEYVQGRDLFDYFIDEKPHKQPYVASLGGQITASALQAVSELHYYGLFHRDLKLENLVLDESRNKQKGKQLLATVKIIDFDTIETIIPGRKWRHVLGTDQYIAPECYIGCASCAADIFSVGVVAYTLMSGTFPFHSRIFTDAPGENYVGHPKMAQIRDRIYGSRINFSDAVWSECPPCKRFVLDCMDMDPSRRPNAQGLLLHHPWLKGQDSKLTEVGKVPSGSETNLTEETRSSTAKEIMTEPDAFVSLY
jgi:serine/threonine protein kinase